MNASLVIIAVCRDDALRTPLAVGRAAIVAWLAVTNDARVPLLADGVGTADGVRALAGVHGRTRDLALTNLVGIADESGRAEALEVVVFHLASRVHAAAAAPLARVPALGIEADLVRGAVRVGDALGRRQRLRRRRQVALVAALVGVALEAGPALALGVVVLHAADGVHAAEAGAGVLAADVLAHEVVRALAVVRALRLAPAVLHVVAVLADAVRAHAVLVRHADRVGLARVWVARVVGDGGRTAAGVGAAGEALVAEALLLAVVDDLAVGVGAARALLAELLHDRLDGDGAACLGPEAVDRAGAGVALAEAVLALAVDAALEGSAAERVVGAQVERVARRAFGAAAEGRPAAGVGGAVRAPAARVRRAWVVYIVKASTLRGGIQ